MLPDLIYALAEPGGAIRYVGRTTNVCRRLRKHLSARNAIGDWARGCAVVVIVLEAVPPCVGISPGKREAFWIETFRAAGADLLNVYPLPSRLVCGLCDRRADDPAVKSCTHTDCGLAERRAA